MKHPFGYAREEVPRRSGGGTLLMAELPGLVRPCRVEGMLSGRCMGITYDSRCVRPGMVFVALPGRRTDGRAYIPDAVARGAGAILGDGQVGGRLGSPVIQVADPRRAMGSIAAAFHLHPSLHLEVVGVTGTNGKTSVTWLTRHLIEAAGRRSGLIGTVHHDVGGRVEAATRTTPESPDLQDLLARMVRNGCDYAVMEVSSHALHQERVRDVDFDVAVFTNLTPDHLDYHGSMEAYFEAKARLFGLDGDKAPGRARVVNIDDPWGAELARRAHGAVISYGMGPEAQVRASSVELGAWGTRFDCASPWGSSRVEMPLIGRFNIYNALAALAAGGALSFCWEDLVEGLSAQPRIPGRLERMGDDHGPAVFVDYAHTEDALQQVLRTLRPLTRGRLICVFGCGGDRDRGKRPRMGAVAARWADLAVITSDNPRSEEPESIMAEVAAGCGGVGEVWTVTDRAEAIVSALAVARPDDVVVIAGKGHETVQEIGTQRLPFDDRDVVAHWMQKSGKGTNHAAY